MQARSAVLPGGKGRTLSEQQGDVRHGSVHYKAQHTEPAAKVQHDELPHSPVHEASGDIKHPAHQPQHEEQHISVKHTEPAARRPGSNPTVHAPYADGDGVHHPTKHIESEATHEEEAHVQPVQAPGEHVGRVESQNKRHERQPLAQPQQQQRHEEQEQQAHRELSEPGKAKAQPAHAPDPVPKTHTTDTHQHVNTPAVVHPTEEHGFFALSAKSIDGVDVPFKHYAGKVLLVVNVASACGFTDANYRGLQKTYEKYKDHGLEILGFPCNQFGHQEPGSESEIKTFCTDHFHVTFPMFSKIDVNGPHTSPVYQFLKANLPVSEGGGGGHGMGTDIGWNFFKFLVDHKGMPVKRFDMQWDAAAVEGEIYKLLAARNGIQ